MKKSLSLLVVLFVVFAVGISACKMKSKNFVYQAYSGIEPNMSVLQAKDYCGAVATNAKIGAESAFRSEQSAKKRKTYQIVGSTVYEDTVSGGFWGGLAEGLSERIRGSRAYDRVYSGCMTEQGYKLTEKTSVTSSSYKETKSITSSSKPIKEALNEHSATVTAAKKRTYYCLGSNNYTYTRKISCNISGGKEITKTEYDRLNNKKSNTASKSSTSSGKKIVYCKRGNGSVYLHYFQGCAGNTIITKTEYDRLKHKEPITTTVSSTDSKGQEPDIYVLDVPVPYVVIKLANVRVLPESSSPRVRALPKGSKVTALGKVKGKHWYLISSDGYKLGYIQASLIRELTPSIATVFKVNKKEAVVETKPSTNKQFIKDKLKGLKEMVDEGLITEEEAAQKRVEILNDY